MMMAVAEGTVASAPHCHSPEHSSGVTVPAPLGAGGEGLLHCLLVALGLLLSGVGVGVLLSGRCVLREWNPEWPPAGHVRHPDSTPRPTGCPWNIYAW